MTRQGKFVGMISRRLFFERVNRRYGLEMFFQRPIEVLYQFSRKDMLLLSSNTLIVEAAQESLYRTAELVYDPIVVEVNSQTYVNGLHNFSHMDETKAVETDINECVDSTLLLLKNRLKNGVEVIKDYGELPLINCYSGQLSQVFLNLLVNALEALAEHAADREIGIQCPQTWQPKIEITTKVLEAGGSMWAAICIADNGPGISPENQQRIFDTFFTTKPAGKGTGMGLAICNQIITEKHRGQLNVRSQPGQNTEFEILLPIA